MMDQSHQLTQRLIAEVKVRLMEESMPRIEKCLSVLPDAAIWQRPNTHSNSIGNLLLHLNGNVRQYILSGLGHQPDTRERSRELSTRDGRSKADLMAKLHQTMAEVTRVLDRLTPEELLTVRPVQCYEMDGIGILVHVTEHFSYHTGQIVFYTKALQDIDMGFYAGVDLEKKGE
ncbi:MAG: DinB family protein [Saprospiraceae bacterium]